MFILACVLIFGLELVTLPLSHRLTGVLFLITGAALIVPYFAVKVRRFHDQDKSSWFLLLGCLPYIGGILIIVFMLQKGTRGDNRFGPDPRMIGTDLADIFA